MDIKMPPYEVYVKTDDLNRIIAVNSSEFLPDTEGWTKIDEGHGDKYHHAQGNYFPKPILEKHMIPVYKLVDGKPKERTQEEIAADIAAIPPPPPSQAERIAQLENQLAAYEAAYTQGVNEA